MRAKFSAKISVSVYTACVKRTMHTTLDRTHTDPYRRYYINFSTLILIIQTHTHTHAVSQLHPHISRTPYALNIISLSLYHTLLRFYTIFMCPCSTNTEKLLYSLIAQILKITKKSLFPTHAHPDTHAQHIQAKTLFQTEQHTAWNSTKSICWKE